MSVSIGAMNTLLGTGATVQRSYSSLYNTFQGIATSGMFAVSQVRGKGVIASTKAMIASGGTVTTVGNTEKIHAFTTSSTFTLTKAGGVADVLLVAGGGGGGGRSGGGGGAGGLIYEAQSNLTVPGSYAITIGGGGGGGGGALSGNNGQTGTNGGNTVAFSRTAIGGGGGGSDKNESGIGNDQGKNGGSGGGGRYANIFSGTQNFNNGGAGTSGQGHAGGGSIDASLSTTSQWNGGGGGGAGGVGGSGTVNAIGNGGPGLYFQQFSSTAGSPSGWFAGGGGGGAHDPTPAGFRGLGGSGGGGNGGDRANLVNLGGYLGSHGDNGVANTGGGGGAGLTDSGSGGNGGNGGSGIVLIRYTTFHPEGWNVNNRLVTRLRASSSSSLSTTDETYAMLSTVSVNTSMAQYYFETFNPPQVLFVNKHVTDNTVDFGFNDVLLLARTGTTWPFTLGDYALNVPASSGFKIFFKRPNDVGYTEIANAKYSCHDGFEESTFSFTIGVNSGYTGNADKRILLGATRLAGGTSVNSRTLHNFYGNTRSQVNNAWVQGAGIDIYMGYFTIV